MRRPAWFTRNLGVLSAVSFAQDAASELLYPLLPLLLTVVLGAPAAAVGIVEGVAEGAAAVTKYFSGRFSDRIGRKPLVGVGYGMAAVGKVIVAAAGVWPIVMVGRVFDRLGKGVRGAPRDALLAEDVPHGQLGRVFGFHRTADTLGAVVGPLIGLGVLAASGGNIRLALWIAVIPAVLSAGLVGFVREDDRERRRAPTGDSTADASQPTDSQVREPAEPMPRHFWVVVALLGVFALVNFPDALLLLRVSELGFSATEVVAAYVVYNLVYTAVSYPAGSLSDRVPRAYVYAIGLACFAVGYLGLGIVNGGWAVIVVLAVYGGFNGFTDGVGKAWISTLVPQPVRGHAQGIFQGLSGAAVLVAGIWAGLLWQVGPGDGFVPLVVSGSLGLVFAVVLGTLGRRLG